MNTDQLFLVSQQLQAKPDLAAYARDELNLIADLPSYRNWATTLAQRDPYRIPYSQAVPALLALGLVDAEGRLAGRVNVIRGRVFLTDGAWVAPNYRAFPFSDESEAMIDLLTQLQWERNSDVAVDLATGCGHTALSLSTPLQALLDINPRALCYGTINKLLNGLGGSQYVSILNNIQAGLPRALTQQADKGLLVVANMPFAPAPSRTSLPLTSGGGRTGLDLQAATFKALAQARKELPAHTPLRAVVMGMTMGDAAAHRWQLLEMAKRMLSGAHLNWVLLQQHQLMRLNGSRAVANPSPGLVALPAIASCELYHPEAAVRAKLAASYESLAHDHVAQGNPDMAFGAVLVEW